MRTMFLFLCFLAAAEPARAENLAGHVLLAYPTEDWAKSYLEGLSDGISWYNAKARGREIYCPPGNLAITIDQYAAILRRRVQEHPDEQRDFAGNVLIKALADTFPCRR